MIHRETFSVETAHQIIRFADEYHCYAQTYGGAFFYYNMEGSPYAERYAATSRLKGVFVGDLIAFIQNPCSKIMLISDPDQIAVMREDASERFRGILTVTSSKPQFLELNPLRATKAIALEKVLAFYGIPLSEAVAFGDSLNDLSMLQACGRSVSVSNARTEVRDLCDDVCLSNEEDGVAHYLLDHYLNGGMSV